MWAEFPYFVSGQALALSRQPGLQLGRSADDPVRLEAVRRMAAATPAEAGVAVRRAARDAVATIREIPLERWQSLGQHRRQGAMTVADFVEQMMVVHSRAHRSQAQAAVEAVGGGA